MARGSRAGCRCRVPVPRTGVGAGAACRCRCRREWWRPRSRGGIAVHRGHDRRGELEQWQDRASAGLGERETLECRESRGPRSNLATLAPADRRTRFVSCEG